jgi:hypothetical protein
MTDRKSWSKYGRHIYLLKRIRSIGLVLLPVLVITLSILIVLQLRNGTRNERRDLLQVWNGGNFEQAYEISRNALLENPLDYFMLTINGFSAYQLGISQINNQNADLTS